MDSASAEDSGAATALAARLLARFGGDLRTANRPPDSQSNEVWLARDVVLRMGARERADGSLLREARLAAILPPEVGYFSVLGSGVAHGYEWMVAERLPGVGLSEVWDALGESERRAATDDLWARIAAVHRTDAARARRLRCTATPFYALDARVAVGQLRALAEAGALDRDAVARIGGLLDALFAAVPLVPQALAHTDLHQGNAVWDGNRAIPLDFEFACVGPCDLDVESLLRSFAPVPGSALTPHVAGLARKDLVRRGARERIVGYAVLRDLWALNLWLRKATSRDDLETWEPWLDLRAHAAGTSWAARLWE